MEVEVPVFKIEKRNLDITGITLLTTEEAKATPLHSKEYYDIWWLQTPGYCKNTIAFVDRDGKINYNGKDVRCAISVRPALKIKDLKASTFSVGNIFYFYNWPFEIISDSLALCTGDIGCHYFRYDYNAENANDYEASDVKKFVDEWFEKAKGELA